MKITKETLIQLIKEELQVTLNEKRGRFSDLIAIDQARDVVHADIDAEYSYAPEVAKKMKAIYDAGKNFVVDPIEDRPESNPGPGYGGGSYDALVQRHINLREKGTSASRRYYKKGISDAKRILGARRRPFEREGYRTEDEPESAPGPYKDLYRARTKDRRAQADAKRKTSAQAKNPAGAYQALGDAAMRGSGEAISRLMDAAETDPAAQAILDAVEEAEREANRKTPLSADLEADMLEEIIFEEFEAVLAESDVDNDPLVQKAKTRMRTQCKKDKNGDECKRATEKHKNARRVAQARKKRKK